VEPDGLSILHESGTAKVPFEKLAPEMQAQFGYDAAAAESHRQKMAKLQAASARSEGAAVEKQKEKARASSEKDADAKFREKVGSMAILASVDAFQSSDVGLIGTIVVKKPVSRAIPGTMVHRKIEWVTSARESGVICDTTGAKAEQTMIVHPNGWPTTYESGITWRGRAWRIGFIEYETQMGLVRKCPLFTASDAEAVKFFKTHGFTDEAVTAVRRAK
jgi:hypothetical protein